MATVFITRKHKQGTYTIGMYLIDTYCLGVKDTFFKFNIDEEDYNYFIMSTPNEMMEISYNEAHNIIFAAIEFAEEGGIKPHKDWALTRYILEEDNDNIPLIEYEMGKDGEHFLVVHNNYELSTYLPTLKKNLGEDVKYLVRIDLDEEDDEDDEDWDNEDDEDWDDEDDEDSDDEDDDI